MWSKRPASRANPLHFAPFGSQELNDPWQGNYFGRYHQGASLKHARICSGPNQRVEIKITCIQALLAFRCSPCFSPGPKSVTCSFPLHAAWFRTRPWLRKASDPIAGKPAVALKNNKEKTMKQSWLFLVMSNKANKNKREQKGTKQKGTNNPVSILAGHDIVPDRNHLCFRASFCLGFLLAHCLGRLVLFGLCVLGSFL